MESPLELQRGDATAPDLPHVSAVLVALRAATAERHRIVDRSMPLSRSDPTTADYLLHLHLMRAWLQPLESWLDGTHLRQTALIDADLADAGMPPVPAPACIRMTQGPSSAVGAYRWGARYVIEGSRLGAAMLYGKLKDGLRPAKLRFLRGDPGDCSHHWSGFLRELGIAVQSNADISAACQGACDAFDELLALATRRQT